MNDALMNYWNTKHQSYSRDSIVCDDWLSEFSSIIDAVSLPILDLGCGSGNDTLWLINRGNQVVAADFSENAIKNIMVNFPEALSADCFDMATGLPYGDNSFSVVVADLSLHYFDEATTFSVLDDIRRVLIPGGHLIARVNSMSDINFGAGQGQELEKHLYSTSDGRYKRFFDEEDIRYFFKNYELDVVREEVMGRYSKEKKLFVVNTIVK